GAIYNYLIGTVPALGPLLVLLDVRGNFITDVPAATYTYCGGYLNCLPTPSKCPSGGTTQRSVAACSVCGTTNGVGPFCASAGGVCSVDAAALVTAGTANSPSQPVLPLACVGGTSAVAIKESTGRQGAGGMGQAGVRVQGLGVGAVHCACLSVDEWLVSGRAGEQWVCASSITVGDGNV
ncbi:unnamed protein product, partial [Closterium sp. NIES-54]